MVGLAVTAEPELEQPAASVGGAVSDAILAFSRETALAAGGWL